VGLSHWYCYLIKSHNGRRTYVGYTDDIIKRLRKHNGELTGGAKATKIGRPWTLVAHVCGFLNKNEAMTFEWYMHHPKSIFRSKTNRSGQQYRVGSGLQCRLEYLAMLVKYGAWRTKYQVKDTIMTIFWHIDHQFETNSLLEQYHHRSIVMARINSELDQ
jgi:predicted GIY-YIG superfamily endonuclease